jgi:hypothetical protein
MNQSKEQHKANASTCKDTDKITSPCTDRQKIHTSGTEQQKQQTASQGKTTSKTIGGTQ